jgi:glycosyltransferase involved in cell wall biosynthesis
MQNLKNTLCALELQSCTDFEVIIVNDGSSDPIHDLIRQSKLDIKYILTEKYLPIKENGEAQSRNSVPPRNRGAMLARGTHYLFLDSDVILDKQAVEFYYQNIESNPIRCIMGMYDWLPPCRITFQMIKDGLDSIYGYVPYINSHNEPDEDIKLNIPKLAFPEGGQTHNVCRDLRRKMFLETGPLVIYTGPGNLNVYLGSFSGNALYSRETFWSAGGYWDTLTAGIVDDGSFGLTLWLKSVWRDQLNRIVFDENGQATPIEKFGISLDKRIRGAHQYHPRNVQFVQETTIREVDYINRMFGLEQYNDGRLPVLPKSIQELTQDVNFYWQVDGWK